MRRNSAKASAALRSSSPSRASLMWLLTLFRGARVAGVAVVGDSVMCSRGLAFCCASSEFWAWDAITAGGGVPVLAARPKRGIAFEKLEVKRLPRLSGFMEVMKFVAAASGSLWSVAGLLLVFCDGWVLRLMLLVVLLRLSTLRSRFGPRPARISSGRLLVVVDLGLLMAVKGSSGDERPEPVRVMLSSSAGGETSFRASSRVLGMVTGSEPGVTWSLRRLKRELRLFSSVPLIES